MSDEGREQCQTGTVVSDGDVERFQTETGTASGGDRGGVRRRKGAVSDRDNSVRQRPGTVSDGDRERCQTETGRGVRRKRGPVSNGDGERCQT